jgi:NitT/TauT family transport system substrate-binding protein
MSIRFDQNGRSGRAAARRGARWSWVAVLVVFSLVATACGGDDDDDDASTGGAEPAGSTGGSGSGSEGGEPEGTLSLGYFPNVTHAPAIIGVEDGLFEDALGPGVELDIQTFNAGTEAIEALFAGDIDASFIGPNPAINGFAQSDGDALRIVSGTTSGGAALVVADGIDSSDDLTGKTLATPSLGNTQDVALRAWLKEEGFETDTAGGGDVEIIPQDNADSLTAFQDGAIDGAWVPEPWATRLVQEGGGHVLVDEADLWPEGQFVTTHLIVATDYLDEHPDIVKALLTGLLDAIDVANDDAAAAQATVNDGIEAITTKRLADATISNAWENLSFTADPVASSLQKSKDDAVDAGLLDDVDLDGIYDLTLLNEVLTERGDPEVEGL